MANQSELIIPDPRYERATSNMTEGPPWHLPLSVASYYTILAPVTVLGNGFLILTFVKNAYTFLRAPSNFLLISMAVANFITGLVVEPLAAYTFFMQYLETDSEDVHRIAVALSMVTMNASVFSVCAFSWEHFLVVHRPGQYKKWVNTRRVKVFIVSLWLYETMFALLPFMNIPTMIVYQIDLHFNTTIISLLLLCSYVCLFLALKRQGQRVTRSSVTRDSVTRSCVTRSSVTRSCVTCRGSGGASCGTSSDMERRVRWIIFLFTVVTTIHILPITVVWYLKFYCAPCRESLPLQQAEMVLNQFIFVKFALDPFVYAWRLSKYRSALRRALCCSKQATCD